MKEFERMREEYKKLMKEEKISPKRSPKRDNFNIKFDKKQLQHLKEILK